MAGARGRPPSAWVAIAAVAALAVGVGILAVLAYQQANPEVDPGEAAPVPTFTLGGGSETSAGSPTATPAAEQVPRETERSLAVGSQAMWRATAGVCGGAEPRVDWSGDGGRTWTDVTPRYLGLGQVASIDSFTVRDAEMVAGVGPGCETQALRTYTDGEFWASYPDVLAASRYIDLADPSLVHLGRDGTTAAPCTRARGLRASGDVIALICDGRVQVWNGSAWSLLAPQRVAALAVDDGAVVVAHVAEGCDGVAITRVAASAPENDPGTPVGCAEGTDAASPTALDVYGDGVLVWSGEDLVTLD
jgi:hypothetical protein